MVIYNLTLMDWNNEYHWEMKLIKELLQHYEEHGNLHISLQGDGLDIEASGLSSVLNIVCSLLNVGNVTIYNSNLLEGNTLFNDVLVINSLAAPCRLDYKATKDIQNTFCMFVGRPSWDRLALGSWLYNNATNPIQTYQAGPEQQLDYTGNVMVCNGVGYDDLIKRAIPGIDNLGLLDFMSALPLKFKGQDHNKDTAYSPLLLEEEYKSSFIEIVAETAKVGNVFFPTEKTFRPILFRTPFVVYGPVNYLKNLRKLGFETFGEWFDESYDHIEDDNQRLMAILRTTAYLNTLPIDMIKRMYKEMNVIVEHNYWTMMNLQKADFNRERFL